MTEHVLYQPGVVSRHARERLNGHRAIVIWFTGLSGAGKSTLAAALEAELHRQRHHTLVLDGDHVRQGLCRDLGFSAPDRHENLRRVAELARITLEAGVITLAAFISPLEEDRAMVRKIVGEKDLFEIYVRCPLAVCEARDVKGLYRKARSGEIADFTGISAPYETPETADLVLDTSLSTVSQCLERILSSVALRLRLAPLERQFG